MFSLAATCKAKHFNFIEAVLSVVLPNNWLAETQPASKKQ